MEKKTYYLSELQRQAREELEDRIKWCRENEEQENSDDLIHEVADNNIPIYTYDLLQYASNNFDLIYKNDLCSDDADCIQIIQANIYELLMDDLYEYLTEKHQEERKEDWTTVINKVGEAETVKTFKKQKTKGE